MEGTLPTAIYAELLQDLEGGYDLAFKRFLDDPNWVWQEKWNGDRRLILKEGNTIQDFNRKGERGKGLPPEIIAALKAHPLHRFIIDCEWVRDFNQLVIFDMLIAGDDVIATNPYSSRLSYIHMNFDGFNKRVLPIATAVTRAEKLALVERLIAEHAEGFVMKELSKPYRESNKAGTLRYNYRVKFWKTLDAVVLGDSTKIVDGNTRDSVRLGLYMQDGSLKDICGASKKARYSLKIGDVVEIKYLYGTGTFDIVQIDILHLRDDKTAEQCTIDQIVINKNWFMKGVA
jgi:ATP-dependent DNA ligase